MITEYIRYELKEHAPEALVEAYTKAGPYLDAAPECLGFDLARCVEAPGVFILRIQWQSADAHMQGFRKGPQFPGFLAAVRPFIGEIAEMRHYTAVSLSGGA